MPLHLLGKKSWNVYNSVNIERVKRDEAEAKAREEAEEQRLQQEDAAHRTRLLRDETQATAARDDHVDRETANGDRDIQRVRKRRRLQGEDDTDRDIRWAREDAEQGHKAAAVLTKHTTNDIPLQDQNGHIQLVPVPDAKEASKIERNAEAEVEKARKKRHDEDQYTMRFSNAAGVKSNLSAPWYAGHKEDNETSQNTALIAMPEKDVWGNEDPLRIEREQRRVNSSDPLAFMQQAQRQLKQSAQDRDRWQARRTAELRDLERDQRKRRRHHKREDDLESFSLDTPSQDAKKSRRHDDKHHSRHHHRHRSRSRHCE